MICFLPQKKCFKRWAKHSKEFSTLPFTTQYFKNDEEGIELKNKFSLKFNNNFDEVLFHNGQFKCLIRWPYSYILRRTKDLNLFYQKKRWIKVVNETLSYNFLLGIIFISLIVIEISSSER